MRCQLLVMVGLLAVSVSNSAHGVTIDFDSLERWDVVTTQFPEASFSTEDGFQITVRCSISRQVPVAKNFSPLKSWSCSNMPWIE